MTNEDETGELRSRLSDLETQQNLQLTQIVELKRQLSDCRNEQSELESEKQHYEAKILEMTGQVSNLESELRKRNEEVCSFLGVLKQLKIRNKGGKMVDNLINNDVIDLEEEEVVEGASEDINEIVTQSKAILEEILEESSTEDSTARKLLGK